LPRKSLEYFTEIHSINQKEAKLPKGECCNELYNLLTNSINYSPIRVLKAIKMARNNVLFENIEKIINTLESFVEKEFKESETGCPNDILAFKLHFFKYIFDLLRIHKKNISEKISDQNDLNQKIFEKSIKFLLTESEIKTGNLLKKHRVNEEKYLRELIRQFPYKECAIVKQMVTILAKILIGDKPSALEVINGCLNGQRLNENASENFTCSTCYEKNENVKLCSNCRNAAYCDQFCQKSHWFIHKKECKAIDQLNNK